MDQISSMASRNCVRCAGTRSLATTTAFSPARAVKVRKIWCERNKLTIHYYFKNNNLYYQLLYQLRIARVLTKQCLINYVKYVAFIITIIYIRIDRLPYNLVQMLSSLRQCALTFDPRPYLKGQGHTRH